METPEVEYPETDDRRMADEAYSFNRRLRSTLISYSQTDKLAALFDEVWAAGYRRGWEEAWRRAESVTE